MRDGRTFKAADFRIIKGEKRYEEQMKNLWAECFPEDKDSGFIPFFFAERYRSEETYLIVYRDKLCAMMYAPRMKYHFCGVDFDVPYIQGVATDPDFRNLGLANRLLAEALNRMNLQGVPFGILKPFNVDFYAKSGWRLFAELSKMPLSAVKVPGVYLTADCGALAEELQIAEIKNYEDYIEDLAAVFLFWQKTDGNAYALRDHEGWSWLLRDHFNDGGRLFAVFYRGKMLAYGLYLQEDAEITLRETAYSNEEAFYRLLIFLAELCDEPLDSAVLHLPVNSRLLADCVDKSKISLEPFAMLRVINVETLLSALDLGISSEEAVYLQINDNVVKNNNGVFVLEHHDCGSLCQKAEIEKDVKSNDEKTCCGIAKNLLRKIDVNWLTDALSECYNFKENKAEPLKKNCSENSPGEFSEDLTDKAGCAYFNEYF